jgi:hypothetical protein
LLIDKAKIQFSDFMILEKTKVGIIKKVTVLNSHVAGSLVN